MKPESRIPEGFKFTHTHTQTLHDEYAAKGDKQHQLFDFAMLPLEVRSLVSLLRGNAHARKVAETFSSIGAFTMDALNFEVSEFEPVLAAVEKAVLADTKESMAANGVEPKDGALVAGINGDT